MAEWRTQEQVDADEALHKAIHDVLRVYSTNTPEEFAKFMLADYVVITSSVGITDDKANSTTYDYSLSRGSIPWHTMMGLMGWADLTMREQMKGSNEDSA